MLRNSKKLLQFRKLNSNKKKNSDDISKSIIEILRQKMILFEKIV